MRNAAKSVLLPVLAALLLAACSLVPTAAPSDPPATRTPPAATETAAPTQTPTEARTEGSASAAVTPVPLPTANIIPDLPDPKLWAASLAIGAVDYPVVDGSTATMPLMIYLRAKMTGESLEACTAGTTVTTTGPSYIALAEGRADLLVVYEAPDEVKRQLTEMGAKLKKEPIGRDALVFLTNDGNPVENLSHRQILDIYTGKITNWSEMGGADIEIVPYQRVSNSGSQALMKKLVMKDVQMMEAPTMLQPAEMGELLDALAAYENTENALGYSVYYYVRNMYLVPGIKLLGVNGVKPESSTIASGAYPYINPFYAVIREDEPADSPAHQLYDWLTGAEGKRAVEDAGYVPPVK